MGLTTDRNDPALKKIRQDGQQESHIILPDEERAKGFVRPVRRSYVHKKCDRITKMPQKIAETYARDPKYYGSTFCTGCGDYYPVNEFIWLDNPDQEVGS